MQRVTRSTVLQFLAITIWFCAGSLAPSLAEPGKDLSRYSLWKGLNAPMVLPADHVMQVSLDQALAESRTDYARKILGLKDGGNRDSSLRDSLSSLPPANPILRSSPKPTVKRASAESFSSVLSDRAVSRSRDTAVFVRMELNMGPPMTGRDILEELFLKTGFVTDSRFPGVQTQNPPKLHIWGWMPPQSLEAAIHISFVTRIEMENSAASPEVGEGTTAEMLLALRMPSSGQPAQEVAVMMKRIFSESGFIWRRTIGVQNIPHSDQRTLIVLGKTPIRRLDKLLGDPDVVKLMASPDSPNVSFLGRSRRSARYLAR